MSKLKQSFLGCLVFTAVSMLPIQPSFAQVCTNPDCIQYKLDTQAKCTLEQSGPRRNRRWTEGLNTEIDNTLLNGDVVAYKVRWGGGGWSSWYVTGVNDIDWKYNTIENDMRRVWAYFNDKQHQYIICREPGQNANSPQLRVR